jgi:hypothetical protein
MSVSYDHHQIAIVPTSLIIHCISASIIMLQSTTLGIEIIKYVVFRMYNGLLADMSKLNQLQSFSLYNYNNH